MTKKSLKIYFLDVLERGTDQTASGSEIGKLFSYIESISLDKNNSESRVLTMGDNVYYLLTGKDDKSIPQYPNCITGLFVKDRHFNYPYESSVLCELSKLALKKSSNTIAEMTYFLIDLNLSILVWVSNRYVAGYSRLDDYLNTLSAYNNGQAIEIELNSLVRSDAIERLEKSDTVKSFVFKSSAPIDKLITNKDGDILQKVGILEDIPSDSVIKNVEVKVTLNAGLNTKQRNSVKQYVLSLFEKKILEKAQASIVLDDVNENIDFLDSQLFVTGLVTLSGQYTDYQVIFNLLHDNLQEKKSLIKKNYRQK